MYDQESTGSAAEDLTGPETDNDSGRDDTYFLPKEALAGKTVKSGDVVKFRVVGADKDGAVEVECIKDEGEGKPSWQDDMRQSVNPVGMEG